MLAASAAFLSLALAGPAFAADNGGAALSDAQKVVESAAHDIQTLKAHQDFANLLKKAKGVYIIPDLIKGELVVGGSGGTGVLLAHDSGHWSDPAFMTIGSDSIGAQAGAPRPERSSCC